MVAGAVRGGIGGFCLVLVLSFLVPGLLRAQESGSIQGSVVEAGTQRPLEAVSVRLVDRSENAFTDARGRFLILNLPAGSYEVVVERVGWIGRASGRGGGGDGGGGDGWWESGNAARGRHEC